MMRTKLTEAKTSIELPKPENVCTYPRNDVREQNRNRQNQQDKVMAMVVPCPSQPIAERDQDCWCEELVDVEELHEESTLSYARQRADLVLYQPEDVRDARRADATPLARA